MPLPRLQRFGSQEQHFIYRIGWDENIKRGAVTEYQRQFGNSDGVGSGFDNRIHLVDNVGDNFIRLAPLLRPLVQREWATTVASFNRLPFRTLESFLFNPQRQSLTQLADPLSDVQEGLCFYCRQRIKSAAQIDHFIPWSRCPNDGFQNFVLAHSACNLSKSNHLASVVHLKEWVLRNNFEGQMGHRFRDVVENIDWLTNHNETLSVARSVYRSIPPSMPLWLDTQRFELAEHHQIHQLLIPSTID
jgi:hypothetical protein